MRAAPLILTALLLGTSGCGDTIEATPGSSRAPESTEKKAFEWPETGPTAVLHIRDYGTIEIALHPDLAPANVANFVRLAEEGFYDGTSFHRVIPDFMIQGGDPNTRDKDPTDDGLGGPGYQIQDEFSDAPHVRGVVSMANTGLPDTGGSQFFIVHNDVPHLDGSYTVLGRVTSGIEVVDAIAAVETDRYGRWGPENRPLESVVVEKVEIRPAG